MQKINIDWIIEKLKNTDEWEEYKTKLEWNLELFWKNFSIEQLISKEWIINSWKIELIENNKKEKDIEKNNFWKWVNRQKNFSEFKNLEMKFLNLFLEGVKFCPYCWKIPLIRYENDKYEKKWTFHLDHIFPKSKHRYLTYNFYNLIPSCSICNQLKWAKNMFNIKEKIFHPYFWWLVKNWNKLEIENKTFDKKINFDINNEDEEKKLYSSKHFKFFSLDKIYLNSQDTKNDIWFIRDKIEHIKTNETNDKNLWLGQFNLEERKEIFFKNYYPKTEQEILKYSNWKLKKDLIENIII